jgi:hypothetical protein
MYQYNLDFISDENFENFVSLTLNKYILNLIDLRDFLKNQIDPIKLTFDQLFYGKSIESLIEDEINRQIDKANNNIIGQFHQNIFHFIGTENGWIVPSEGWDIINEVSSPKYYIEMKNKHNTMNSSSAEAIYRKMERKCQQDQNAICLLVEIIAKKRQDKIWELSIDKQKHSHPRIRKASIDVFYELVTGDPLAFKKMCKALPIAINRVQKNQSIMNPIQAIINDIKNQYPQKTLLEALYLMTFSTYQGFDDF